MVATFKPRDEADVADIVTRCSSRLELLGGGSKRAIGRCIEADVLDLSGLSGIIDYEPEELVLTAHTATPLDEVQRTLAAAGQRLAFDPPDLAQLLGAQSKPTIGGVLATNLSGSRRVTAGAARDHFLGCRAVTGRGERFKGGGRVVKNVTGYDMPKLLAGSWGTLAVLTEITIRVHPAPEHERTLVIPAAGAAAAVDLMGTALSSACDVSAAAFAPGRGVALRLEGFVPSVDARSSALLELLGGPDHLCLEAEVSRRYWEDSGAVVPLAHRSIVWRLCVPPRDAVRIIDALAPPCYLLDWGGGLIWIGADEVDAERIRGALHGGHATLIKAPESVRAAVPVFQPLPAPLAAISARLKAALDPHGKLNPGRLDA